jgi:hypothetical protein
LFFSVALEFTIRKDGTHFKYIMYVWLETNIFYHLINKLQFVAITIYNITNTDPSLHEDALIWYSSAL